MAKYISGFLILMLGMSILGAVMAGGGGVSATPLTSDISATTTTVPVADTTGFLNVGLVVVGSETMQYGSKDGTHFYISQRGYNGTPAAAHTKFQSDGSRNQVYSLSAGIINNMATYDISQISSATGIAAFILVPYAFASLIVNIFTVDFTFFGTDLAIIGYVYSCMCIAFLITVAIYLAGARTP